MHPHAPLLQNPFTMVEAIIRWSVRNRFLVLAGTAAWIAAGLYSLKHVKLGTVPDITNNQVQVITVAPQLSALEIERSVTYPVELAMSNLPGLVELRSISRAGLSVVTVVFEDRMGTWLPRQLVAEKLAEVAEQLPDWIDKPFMAPPTTGLGEIFQYTLVVDSPYQDKYTLTDLRTIHDWLVRRQLSMIDGVVEVNTYGGWIRQWEVVLSPHRLKSMGVTLEEVFEALERNNRNSGGAYIEKWGQAVFIRSEGIFRSLDEVKQVVVKTVDGMPITIGDIAEDVRIGRAVRYGAVTQDGKEVVTGQVLMLRGANTHDVVQRVKERIEQIQKSLPPGVRIVPYLDRADLISRTTETIRENLTIGALTVMAVLVILLGSIRSGLVVASVIPLSLLFAFILMRVFGITANLMSLGAIDFGILVDGAVIIVEGVVAELERRLRGIRNRIIAQELGINMQELTAQVSTRMMRVAIFGQMVVLIVFAPVLALTGIEGKMFKPMAYVFMFALLGVMILCLTFVPAISTLVVRLPEQGRGLMSRIERYTHRWSLRLINAIHAAYVPLREFALRRPLVVIAIALGLFVFSIWLFGRLGAVFMPRLDEGDIAVQMVFKPGTSLSEAIYYTEKMQLLLKDSFPQEVKTALCRLGVARIPTDPMPMDLGDCYVILEKDRSKWRFDSKDELINAMKRVLEQFQGVNFLFTQPIELRFNELLTGIREDIAVKIFGEDIDTLYALAVEMEKRIRGIPGVADSRVEAVTGLPVVVIRPYREALARYGISIEEINRYVEAAFAGTPVGIVFEGDMFFDLVVRFAPEYRGDIEHIRNLYIPVRTGEQVPLSSLADIRFEFQPMQISRENSYRRIYIGINVRGRDIESVVKDIQKAIADVPLPPGYWIKFGGSFENLQRARARLSIVVPAALALIFIMIYMALRSFRDTLIIYTAVPMAMIGGVLILWLRGMPFSISAGVGFVVLFGVAVLNGMILLSRLQALAREGVQDVFKRVRLATDERLRPILLTAITTIMGFLPMAYSTSAGAEVQRPLATVVIGGLLVATFLSLVVLPAIYVLVVGRRLSWKKPALNTGKESRGGEGKGPDVLKMLFTGGVLLFASITQPVRSQPVVQQTDFQYFAQIVVNKDFSTLLPLQPTLPAYMPLSLQETPDIIPLLVAIACLFLLLFRILYRQLSGNSRTCVITSEPDTLCTCGGDAYTRVDKSGKGLPDTFHAILLRNMYRLLPGKIPNGEIFSRLKHLVVQGAVYLCVRKCVQLINGHIYCDAVHPESRRGWILDLAHIGERRGISSISDILRIASVVWSAIVFFLTLSVVSRAQQPFTLKQAIEHAWRTHPAIQARQTAVEAFSRRASPLALPYRLAPLYSEEEVGRGSPGIQTLGISTGDINPFEYRWELKARKAAVHVATASADLSKWQVARQVAALYWLWLAQQQRLTYWEKLYMLYARLDSLNQLRVQVGAMSPAEYAAFAVLRKSIEAELAATRARLSATATSLQTLLQMDTLPPPGDTIPLAWNASFSADDHPEVTTASAQAQLVRARARQQAAMLLPSLSATYGWQRIDRVAGYRLLEVGISIPINVLSPVREKQAATLFSQSATQQVEATRLSLTTMCMQTHEQLTQLQPLLTEYAYQTLPLLHQQEQAYRTMYQKGQINYAEYVALLTSLINTASTYFNLLESYTETLAQWLYCTKQIP